MNGCLLVAHQHMAELGISRTGVSVEGVVDGHDGTTGIAEDGLNAFGLQCSHQCFRSCNHCMIHIVIILVLKHK